VTARHRVVMVASSYPRFPGDTVGTFMEPIAQGLAGRGHDVHMVLPWHPKWTRGAREGGVTFHLFRYAPVATLNVFGYAGALRADVALRRSAMAATPFALVAGWLAARRVARDVGATLMHGHWIVPGGVLAAAAAPDGIPLVISLHGSDVYLAERHAVVGRAARWAFQRASRTTACSEDLRQRAIVLGATETRSVTIPYGVDAGRFRPDAAIRAAQRAAWGVAPDDEIAFAAGRFVRKKGFEYLVEAIAVLSERRPRLRLVLAGGGDLDAELGQRAARLGISRRIILPGVLTQDEVAEGLAAADVAVVPSVRDQAGNVDGLPNVVLESLSSGTPVVTTSAGGIGAVVKNEETGLLVGEHDAVALAYAIDRLLSDRALARQLGAAGRLWASTYASWDHVAERFDEVYELAASTTGSDAVKNVKHPL
jgi:glycosyltransferase involved in cell wall biosynthesis